MQFLHDGSEFTPERSHKLSRLSETELAKSPLGKALSTELIAQDIVLEPALSYYNQPKTISIKSTPSLKEFWQGQKRLPQEIPNSAQVSVSAIAVKKQGDFPAFWHRDNLFIEAMEELYVRVKSKNKEIS